jgi:hypothetical protein
MDDLAINSRSIVPEKRSFDCSDVEIQLEGARSSSLVALQRHKERLNWNEAV